MFKLLSTANPKIQKGTKMGYLSFILHLAPADLSGKNTCPKATAGCKSACLNTAGRGGMFKKGENTNVIQKARIRKTVQFYDYTKVLGRKVSQYPNYHLTFSKADGNDADVAKALMQGMSVVAVYDEIPAGVPSADETDLRFLDPKGIMLGLKAKGRAKKDYSGFVIRLKEAA